MIDDLRKALELIEELDFLLSGLPMDEYADFEGRIEELEDMIAGALQTREQSLLANRRKIELELLAEAA